MFPPTEALCDQAALDLRLLQIEAHVHLAVHARRNAQVFAGLFTLSSAVTKLGEPQVAMSNKGPHTPWLGEGDGLAVVGLAALSVEAVGVGGNVAEEVLSPGCGPEMRPRMFDCAVAHI